MYTVLLVDDEELALVALRYSFPWEAYGFSNIITTTDSREALKILETRRIDAAFVDIRMPQVSGLDLLSHARDKKLDTLFVIVSGYSDFSYARQAISLGVVDYLLKPVQEEDTVPVLKKLNQRLLPLRLSADPGFLSNLLSDPECCKNYLEQLTQDTASDKLFLLDISSSNLCSLLEQLVSFPPGDIFLESMEDALLIWSEVPEIPRLEAFLEHCRPHAHIIYTTAPAVSDGFQNVLKRIRISRESTATDATGLMSISSISDEMADILDEILSYVNTHYSNDMSLQDLAKQFGINYTYLSAQFHRAVGKSFTKYLTEVRMNHACRMLTDTMMRIGNISESIGYRDCHYFNNVFKQNFGMSPLQYRRAHRRTES